MDFESHDIYSKFTMMLVLCIYISLKVLKKYYDIQL